MDERTKAAFDAAGESVKQLLGLATASIGGAIALFDDDKVAGFDLGPGPWIHSGLAFMALSVLFGLWTMGLLAGQLGSDKIKAPNTYAIPVRVMAAAQMLAYGVGMIAFVLAATI